MPILSDPSVVPSKITATVLQDDRVAVAVDTSALTAGQDFRVTGSTPDGFTWQVRGGLGQVAGGQLLLIDALAPLNTPLVYTYASGQVSYSSVAVSLPSTRLNRLTSLDGLITANLRWMVDGARRGKTTRAAVFPIPGVEFPAVRYDRATAGGGRITASTAGADTATLDALVDSGRAVSLRLAQPIHGIPLVCHLVIQDAPNYLPSAGRDVRQWDLSYLLVADPEPGTLIPVTTWDEWDAFEAGRTWADVDADGLTWDEDDRLHLVDGAL